MGPETAFFWRLGREVSGSKPETLETVGVSGLTEGEIKSEAKGSETEVLLKIAVGVVEEEEKVFCRASVRVWVSRAETSAENQGSRKGQEAVRAGKFSEEVMVLNNWMRNKWTNIN